MKKCTYIVSLLLLMSFTGITIPNEVEAKKYVSQSNTPRKYGKMKSTSSLRGKSYYSYGKTKRIGYYSYRYAQGLNTRKFTDPTLNGQNAFGPLESDYFFSTPRPQIGGDSPYMH